MFDDQVVRIWVVVYDNDPKRYYTFTQWYKVLNSIRGSINSYLGECDEVEKLADSMVQKITDFDTHYCIPIVVNNLQMVIYMWDLDRHNPLHQLLVKCYDAVDDALKLEILSVFNNYSD